MRCCFIINPNSRSQRGRAIWEEVQKELEKSQIKYEIYLTERRKNATAIAAMLTADQEEKTLVVLGGDGTVNEVLNGIQNFENVILGYIPTEDSKRSRQSTSSCSASAGNTEDGYRCRRLWREKQTVCSQCGNRI